MQLPKHVHAVTSRGKTYYYYQEGRGTKNEGPRTPLPRDPQQAEFWAAARAAAGNTEAVGGNTFQAAADAYMSAPRFQQLGKGTKEIYVRELRYACNMWGKLPIAGLQPKHVYQVMERLIETPGKANNFLGTLRAFSKWARLNDWTTASFVEGVEAAPKDGGHEPWTDAQIAAAKAHLTGAVRRGFFLELYTGQRGSDVVRIGPTFIDDDGFTLGQTKTGVRVWCPIVPELAEEMATWERRPGPYLLQESGRPYTRQRLSIHFRLQTENIPELAEATMHGLRATAVVRLRREGLTTTQIQDIVGMSLPMIERYCRFADKKISGQAVLHTIRTKADAGCKTLANRKTEVQ